MYQSTASRLVQSVFFHKFILKAQSDFLTNGASPDLGLLAKVLTDLYLLKMDEIFSYNFPIISLTKMLMLKKSRHSYDMQLSDKKG